MDILKELNLSNGLLNTTQIETAFDVPSGGQLQSISAKLRVEERDPFFERQPQELPIHLKQIKIRKKDHVVSRVAETISEGNSVRDLLLAKTKPTIDYRKIFKDFHYFFNLYPLVSLSNFKAAEKLFVTYFANRREMALRIAEFKKVAESFSTPRDKFGELSFDFKLKEHSLQITMQRSKLKGVKQYLSISLNDRKEFISFTQWNWKHKKEELIRSRNPLTIKEVNADSLAFDAKVWQTFNRAGMRRKHFMKSLDCLERNQNSIIDFINTVNKKTLINLIEPDLFSNVSIKTDNQNTVFLNFRSSSSQKVDVRLTNFASSIVVAN